MKIMVRVPARFRLLLALPLAVLSPAGAATFTRAADWNQWGGSPLRNNAPEAKNVPAEWATGEFDAETGRWKPETSENIAWVAELGSQSYGNPVVAGGKAYVGTNNGTGWLKRYPPAIDLGCLLCLLYTSPSPRDS